MPPRRAAFRPEIPPPVSALRLDADDPPAVERVNPQGRAPILFICDHASPAVPKGLANLGLSPQRLVEHIGWDIGAAEVARHLARRFDAPAVLSGYSRLVIDCNRQPGDPASVPAISDGTPIPANQGLTEADEVARVETFFWPYHHAITDALAHLWRLGKPPILFSVHSFTPVYGGAARPWQAGVLYNRDARMAGRLIAALRRHGDLMIGDNQPYSGLSLAYSIDLHAGAAGLPHCAIEIRQDQIDHAQGVLGWTDLLGEALVELMNDPNLFRVEHF